MMRSKINFLLIAYYISIVVLFEGLFMFLALIVSLVYHEHTTRNLAFTFGLTLFAGALLNVATTNQRNKEPSRGESFFIVTMGWLTLGLVGTLPYLFTGAIPQFVNAFFESISGFTTTGSSILSDIEALPKSILFWRTETHWIGGMGIIVLVIAIMPFLKANGIYLFNSEASVVVEEKVSTRIRYTARQMWLIYLGLTVVETVLLLLGKMPLFDSICHSFATVATGGFSTQNDSIAGYSAFIQSVIIAFMLLSGMNFAMHILSLKGKFFVVKNNKELQLYLSIIAVVGLIVALILFVTDPQSGFEKAFRDSFFQVVSVITATGFATADYLQWPVQSILLIALLMLIGASAGSTGGGVKVIRHFISLKRINQSYRELVSPSTVSVISYNGKTVDQTYIAGVMTFIVIYYSVVATGSFIMTALGNDVATSLGSVITCMGHNLSHPVFPLVEYALSPVNKRGVGGGNNKFEDISSDENFDEHFNFKHAIKSDKHKNRAVDELRNHCAEVVAQPKLMVFMKAFFPEMESPDVVALRQQIGG